MTLMRNKVHLKRCPPSLHPKAKNSGDSALTRRKRWRGQAKLIMRVCQWTKMLQTF